MWLNLKMGCRLFLYDLIYYQYKRAKTFLTFIISRRSTNLMSMAPAVMEPWDMLMSEVKCHAQL
jgi:hypothetical protein